MQGHDLAGRSQLAGFRAWSCRTNGGADAGGHAFTWQDWRQICLPLYTLLCVLIGVWAWHSTGDPVLAIWTTTTCFYVLFQILRLLAGKPLEEGAP